MMGYCRTIRVENRDEFNPEGHIPFQGGFDSREAVLVMEVSFSGL